MTPPCDSSTLAFHMIYSAYTLNKQDDNIQLCCTLFTILNQSVVPCPVLTVGSKVVWYSHLFKNIPQFVVIHTVKSFSVVSEAEVGILGAFLCFFYDPADVGNLISVHLPFLNPACTSGSSQFMYC